jgi:hypothetical protein
MQINNASRAESYYKVMSQKNGAEIEKYLHPNVEFSNPLQTLHGKEAVLASIRSFMNVFKSLAIRAKFGAEDQAMIVYEVDIPGIAKDFPSAALLQFQDGLIIKIQLFFDASSFRERRV